jgi:hypothetical protein
MVARLNPDQKVACLIHVGFKLLHLFDFVEAFLQYINEKMQRSQFNVQQVKILQH